MQHKEQRIQANIPIPQDIWELKRHFDASGKELFVVGGAVRDFFDGKKIKDYDLATNATPEEILDFLPLDKYAIIEAGNIFPVIHLSTPEHGRYEIATFRTDEGEDHRKPETKFATIDQDVKRRDLTVNALFYDLNTGEVVDLIGGLDDLKNNRIRTVGNATKRFKENQIRKLRALRFAARMGGELDDSIKKSLRRDSSLAEEAPEAIRMEFLKGIEQAKDVSYYMRMLFEYNLHKWTLNGLHAEEEFIINEKDASVLLASMVRNDANKDLRGHLKSNLRHKDDFARRVEFFVKFQFFLPEKVMDFHKKNTEQARISDADLKRAASIMGYDQRMVDAFILFEPIADARELMAQGLKGKELGQEMDRINVQHFLSLISS